MMGTLQIFCAFLVFFVVVGVEAQSQTGNNVFKCDESYCLTAEFETDCPPKRNCTTLGSRRYLSPQRCNCCKDTFCSEYIKEGETCSQQRPTGGVDICGPYLTCRDKKCGQSMLH